jgi:hypothetical protein
MRGAVMVATIELMEGNMIWEITRSELSVVIIKLNGVFVRLDYKLLS